jgi:GDP-L-fucose synthase
MTISNESLIYVAGHRGLVGSAILRKLEARGCPNLITRTSRELDLTDQHAVADFLSSTRPEKLFLAAAKVGGILANATRPGEFIRDNLAIQTNVLHQAYKSGVRRLAFLGSSCIYPKMAPQPLKEEYLLTGPLETTNSSYAVAKIAGVEMCHAYNRQYGTAYLPVMPTNLYGPGDNFDLISSHVLPALLRKFHLAKLASRNLWEEIDADENVFGPIPQDMREAMGLAKASGRPPRVSIWGSGSARREFLHVDDMADATVFLALDTDETELINIGMGEDVSIRELAVMIRDIVDYDGEVVFDTSKPDGTPRKLLDVSRLESLGWKPAVSLKEGIRDTYDWYLEQVGLT